ncbi:TetR/AcrR family transcriptional regulator [Acetobacter papayae]|uniref:TetR/AcrR family transcriptional regulator n=1 Tax=Acetobacter papayae TaxID=1076592 RepID=UPI000471DF1D|nr:TetR/AcrR family transcriptional regulator [Acetobacter papayae]
MTKQKKTSEEPGVPRRNNSKQILDAAEKVFSVHGLSGTRIEDIARACGLPKANVLYYFSTKEKLYKATLERVLGHWLANAELHLSAEQDPAEGLRQYVLSKMAFSQKHPAASRLFMHELLAGGRHVRGFLKTTMREHVANRVTVFKVWQEKGLIQIADPVHFLFLLWAMTQSYADMQVQYATLLGRARLTQADFENGTEAILQLVNAACLQKPDGN